MANTIPLYPWSKIEAQRLNEEKAWSESYTENCKCARKIEHAIKDYYANHRLDEQGAKDIIKMFGYDRTNWVLANTILVGEHDGRYNADNKQWSRTFFIPYEEFNLRRNFAVNSHPGLVDLFTTQVRKQWKELGLFDTSHCYDESVEKLDYTGKVLVIDPRVLKDEFKTPDDQLFYASGGNGCRANSLGRKIFGHFLKDGESCYHLRSEIIGAIKLDLLPEWAQEKYAEITSKDTEETLKIGEPK